LTYRIEVRPAAHRDLLKLEPFIRRKVLADVEKLADNPRPHGVEKLEAKDKLYRACVEPGKNYRVIYQIQDEALIVLVVKVGDRKEVYRGLT
jgi:mRNA interferase RelE/StbE